MAGTSHKVLKTNRPKFLRLKDIHISKTYLPIICLQNVSFSRRHQAAVIIVTSSNSDDSFQQNHHWEGRHYRLVRSPWGSVTSPPLHQGKLVWPSCPPLWTEGQVWMIIKGIKKKKNKPEKQKKKRKQWKVQLYDPHWVWRKTTHSGCTSTEKGYFRQAQSTR